MDITKQKETQRYRELVVTSGQSEGGRRKVMVGDSKVHTNMNEINEIQGYIV